MTLSLLLSGYTSLAKEAALSGVIQATPTYGETDAILILLIRL